MNAQIEKQKGFTLIELMITVGVLAVIAAIAIPAYRGYVETGRLTEGWNNLNALNAAEQQFFVENNSYFAGTSAAALSTSSGNLWVQAETTPNFLYQVTGTSATGYTAWAKGTNKVTATVCLKCIIASGQTSCTKLETSSCP